MIGFQRQYAAKGVNEQVDMIIRIHFEKRARIGMYAILGNGEQFEIRNVSHASDNVTRLKYTELTLQRKEGFYDLSETE